MIFKIDINEEHITELVLQTITKRIVDGSDYKYTIAKGISDGISKAVKQYIYSNKESIIDKVIDRASTELVRKSLPKLIDKFTTKE